MVARKRKTKTKFPVSFDADIYAVMTKTNTRQGPLSVARLLLQHNKDIYNSFFRVGYGGIRTPHSNFMQAIVRRLEKYTALQVYVKYDYHRYTLKKAS